MTVDALPRLLEGDAAHISWFCLSKASNLTRPCRHSVRQFVRALSFLSFLFSFSPSRLFRPLHVLSSNQIFEGEGVREVEAHFQWSLIHAASLV